MESLEYNFDKFLKYEELTLWLSLLAKTYPSLITISSIGKSHENRDIWLATITDNSSGDHSTKPAHWVDANIHSVETTAGVAACYLIHYLLTSHSAGNVLVTNALTTRTFYVVPRVNPDGVEAALQDSPMYVRSSVREWPWRGHRWPGILRSDIDGNGKILTMRVKDPHGAWVVHPNDKRVMIPYDHKDSYMQQLLYSTENKSIDSEKDDASLCFRYRLLVEGLIENYDGFTIPTPANIASLDLNRNFPAGWGKDVTGSGDHALSEPEIHALVTAVVERPNICGYNAYHTNGGVLLRPSSVKSDSDMNPYDIYTWNMIGAKGTELTGCPVHSCFDDFTFDKKEACMSGASDDFMYEHLGIFSWTTEFWDIIHAATGKRANTKIWYVGPTVEEELAIAKWADEHAPGSYHDWVEYDHPQLGKIEIGGPDNFNLFTNPPHHMLKEEVKNHALFAIYQAMLSPKLEITYVNIHCVGIYNDRTSTSTSNDSISAADIDNVSYLWNIKIGVSNTGYLPTNVTENAMKIKAVLPVTIELAYESNDRVLKVADGHSPLRVPVGQLSGRSATRLDWTGCDGTPDRALATWLIVSKKNERLKAVASHQRAGHVSTTFDLVISS